MSMGELKEILEGIKNNQTEFSVIVATEEEALIQKEEYEKLTGGKAKIEIISDLNGKFVIGYRISAVKSQEENKEADQNQPGV